MRFASLAVSSMVVLSGAALAAQGDPLVVTGDGVNVRAGPDSGAQILLQVYRNDLAVEVRREGNWIEVRLPDRGAEGWIHGSLLSITDGAGQPVAGAIGGPAVAAPETAAEPPPAPAVAAPPPEPVPPAATPLAEARPAEPPPADAQPPDAQSTDAQSTVSQPAEAQPAEAQPAEAQSAGVPPAEPQAAGSQLAAVGSGDALDRFRDSVSYLNNRAVAAAGIDLFTGVQAAGNGVVQVTATNAWNNVPEGGQESFMRTLYDRWLAAAGGTQPLSVQVVDRSGQVLRERSGP